MMESPDRTDPPPSPCVSVCLVGEDGLCLGCLRTVQEIGRWPLMDAGAQWRLIDQLHERRKRLRIDGLPDSP